MGNFKVFLKKETIPEPKTNCGNKKTTWETFKNYSHGQKNYEQGFLNLELDLDIQMQSSFLSFFLSVTIQDSACTNHVMEK